MTVGYKYRIIFFIAETFDEIDIAANAFFFFVAGSDSTPMTLSYCLYELALNQNIQDKLRSEIQQVQNKYNISNFDSLKEMTYLDAVIAGKFGCGKLGFYFS